MENIQTIIYNANLGYKNIKVSNPIYQAALAESYPPSIGSFTFEYWSLLDLIIGFLVKHKCPLLVNMYPKTQYHRLSNSEYKSQIKLKHREENIWETERKVEKVRES